MVKQRFHQSIFAIHSGRCRVKEKIFLICASSLFYAQISLAQDNLIVFPARVGRITAQSTEVELAKIYGQANLSRQIRPWGDAGYDCATVLFKDTDKEISIFWHGEDADYSAGSSPAEQKKCETLASREVPAAVQLTTNFEKQPPQMPSYWKTPEGVFVGMTLFELERKNGAPIEFESSASCFDGGITSWNSGRLEKLKELLEYSRLSYPLDELDRMKKSAAINSKDLPDALKKKIFLESIDFSFPYSAEGKDEK